MKHLFFLVPDLKEARGIVNELNQVGIEKKQIHVVGKDSDELKNAKVPSATLLQTTDLIHAIKRGIALGALYASAIFLLFYLVLPSEIKFTLLGIGAIIAFGMGFGLWSSGMIAVSTHHPVIDKYTSYVKEGHYIMMVDVPENRSHELIQRVTRHHPGTRIVSRTLH